MRRNRNGIRVLDRKKQDRICSEFRVSTYDVHCKIIDALYDRSACLVNQIRHPERCRGCEHTN